jgi:hypothetical protein
MDHLFQGIHVQILTRFGILGQRKKWFMVSRGEEIPEVPERQSDVVVTSLGGDMDLPSPPYVTHLCAFDRPLGSIGT